MSNLIRITPAHKSLGVSRSTFLGQIRSGLMTQPVKISARAAAIPENELTEIVAARVAGKSDEEIRALVRRLHAARIEAAPAR